MNKSFYGIAACCLLSTLSSASVASDPLEKELGGLKSVIITNNYRNYNFDTFTLVITDGAQIKTSNVLLKKTIACETGETCQLKLSKDDFEKVRTYQIGPNFYGFFLFVEASGAKENVNPSCQLKHVMLGATNLGPTLAYEAGPGFGECKQVELGG